MFLTLFKNSFPLMNLKESWSPLWQELVQDGDHASSLEPCKNQSLNKISMAIGECIIWPTKPSMIMLNSTMTICLFKNACITLLLSMPK